MFHPHYPAFFMCLFLEPMELQNENLDLAISVAGLVTCRGRAVCVRTPAVGTGFQLSLSFSALCVGFARGQRSRNHS